MTGAASFKYLNILQHDCYASEQSGKSEDLYMVGSSTEEKGFGRLLFLCKTRHDLDRFVLTVYVSAVIRFSSIHPIIIHYEHDFVILFLPEILSLWAAILRDEE